MRKQEERDLSGLAKTLRRNMTKEEKRLWYEFLKRLPCTVNRQKQFGNYIADFFCAEAKLVIELDGSQHYEEEAAAKDRERDEYFKGLGIDVLRFSNYDVNTDLEAVCRTILSRINARKF